MRWRSEQGFTLVELLIAIALLAMMMLAVPSTIRLAKRASDTSTHLMEMGDHARAAGFVSRTLTEALPLVEPDETGTLRIRFIGEPTRLSYVTALSGGPEGGGLYRVSMTIPGGGEPDLLLELSPHGAVPPQGGRQSHSSTRRLGAVLPGAGFRYFGVPLGKAIAEWSNTWTRADSLPELVEVPIAGTGTSHVQTSAPLVVELQLRVHE